MNLKHWIPGRTAGLPGKTGYALDVTPADAGVQNRLEFEGMRADDNRRTYRRGFQQVVTPCGDLGHLPLSVSGTGSKEWAELRTTGYGTEIQILDPFIEFPSAVPLPRADLPGLFSI